MTEVANSGQGITPPVSTGTPTPAAPAADAPFYSSFQDSGLKTYAEGKGWKNAEAAVKSAMNAEKMIGVPSDQVFRIPVQGDVDGWKAAYQKLGAPTDAKAYELPTIEGIEANEGYLAHMRDTFLQAGLSVQQAKAVAEANNTYTQQYLEASNAEYETSYAAGVQSLKQEWGQGFERQMGIARVAAEKLGFDEHAIDGLESALGYAGTIKLMASLGAKLGEDRFVAGEGVSGFGGQLTPAQAKQAYNALVVDPNNKAALFDRKHPRHAEVMQQKRELFLLMNPEG